MKNSTKYLPYLLGVGFIFFGAQKFGAENLVFEIIAERSGIDLFEPIIRRLTGIAEILTGLLLLAPRTQRLAALGGIAILLGAIGFHLSPWLGINVPGIGHGLFVTAVVMSVLNAFVAKDHIKAIVKSGSLKGGFTSKR